MNPADVKAALEKEFSGIDLKIVNDSLLLKAEDLLRAAKFLRDGEFKLDYLSSVTVTDYLEYFESVYHLYSVTNKDGGLVVKVRVPRSAPKVPSLVPLYRSAEYQEREAWDMYGVDYQGHPDLRRMFMWEGFEGFPLRKDYLAEDEDVLEWQDVEWLEKHGVKVPHEYKEFAKSLKESGKDARAQRPTEKEPT